MSKFDIYKAGGILIKERRILVEKSFGKDFYIAPGGKVNPGETAEAALTRELQEEFGIVVRPDDLELFGTFYSTAAGQESKIIRMDVFVVRHWAGEPRASGEVEDMRWIATTDLTVLPIGSIFAHQVLPRLKDHKLID